MWLSSTVTCVESLLPSINQGGAGELTMSTTLRLVRPLVDEDWATMEEPGCLLSLNVRDSRNG